MVKFVNITAEDVRKADSYIPIARKSALTQILGPGCIEQVPYTGEEETVPPQYQESVFGKKLVLSYILSGVYMHKIDVSGLYQEEPVFNFSAAQYDQFSQLHRQLEQFKKSKDTEVASKAVEILCDYREFEKMINSEIYNKLQQKNDPCKRIMEMVYMQTTPESIQEAATKMNAVRSELQNFASGRVGRNAEAVLEHATVHT